MPGPAGAITHKALLFSSVALVLGFASGALAQQAAPATAPAAAADEGAVAEVIVTGTRIATPGFTAPTPVTQVGALALETRGTTNAVDIEQDIPALVPNETQNAGGANSTPGSSNLNLRGLGAPRTLLLIDGRRVAPTTPDGSVDVNIIPVDLLDHVDVVTGGASAAYGSDAVSGVVNMTLQDKYQGVKGTVQYGQSRYGDNITRANSLTAGFGFGGGKGHIVANVSNYGDSGETSQTTRPWGQAAYVEYANPAYVVGGPSTRILILPGAEYSSMTNGGLVVSGPLKGTAFGPGGTIVPFGYGSNVGALFMSGGSGAVTSENNQGNIEPEVSRKNGYVHGDFDFSDNLSAWAEAMVTKTKGYFDVSTNYDSGTIVIHNDNAYLPASIKAQMATLKLSTLTIGRTNMELGINDRTTNYETHRYAGGFNGKLGSDWTWNAYVQSSSNDFEDQIANNRINNNWNQGIDPVVNPANGQIVCRTTLTNPTHGCVPIDLLGDGAITPAAAAYVLGTSDVKQTQSETDLAANVQGILFNDWAGPVSLATGIEHRYDKISGVVDPLSATNGWRVQNAKATLGSQSVTEGYGETVIPLLKGQPLVKDLEFNGAVRYTNYNLSGGVWTWKAGLSWQVDEDIRLRGTRSRDIRAPGVNDLYASPGSQPGPAIDDRTGQSIETTSSSGGNPALVPEIGATWTGGLVYQPSWLRGFQASVDLYSIDITGAITKLSTQQVIDGCYRLNEPDLCTGITIGANNAITNVKSVEFNASELKTRGLDLEVFYRTPVSRLIPGANGNLELRSLSTYVDELATTFNGTTIDRAGSVLGGGVPHWRGTLTATYTNGPLKLSVAGDWIQKSKIDSTYVQGVDININTVPAEFVTNISIEYEILKNVRLFALVNNLFNNAPPLAPQEPSAVVNLYNTSAYYNSEMVGQAWALGLRFNF